MLEATTERGKRYHDAIADLPKPLQQVVKDVSKGVEAYPKVNAEILMERFVYDLTDSMNGNLSKFYSPGIYFVTMITPEGGSFADLPLKYKFEAVSRIDAQNTEQKQMLVDATISRLHKNCTDHWSVHSRDRGASVAAWQDFVDANTLFHAFRGRDRAYHGKFPDWGYKKHERIYLPILSADHPSLERPRRLDTADAAIDTELQMQTGRAIGILQPDETWPDFLLSNTAKSTTLSKPKTFFVGERPAVFNNRPTKYDDIKALVMFETHRSISISSQEDLAKLVTEGIISPRVLLWVPVRTLLSID